MTLKLAVSTSHVCAVCDHNNNIDLPQNSIQFCLFLHVGFLGLQIVANKTLSCLFIIFCYIKQQS